MGNGDVSGVLTVKVVRGSNLVVRDLIRHSDPYVVIKLGDQSKKTGVKYKSLNPEWNEELTFTIANVSSQDSCSLIVEVWDKDKYTRDDFMGRGEVELKPFVTQSIDGKGSYKVNHKDLYLKLQKVQSGELHLKLQWQPAQ